MKTAKNTAKKMQIDINNFPVNSSLGHLALGDVAFAVWREVKKKNNINEGIDEKITNYCLLDGMRPIGK
ncbi:MAG: hypothetical protein HKM28_00465 [Flavobacteriaceae bacterium]|nr:hypothetical protein [Flavobacteriaceae bacterium]